MGSIRNFHSMKQYVEAMATDCIKADMAHAMYVDYMMQWDTGELGTILDANDYQRLSNKLTFLHHVEVVKELERLCKLSDEVDEYSDESYELSYAIQPLANLTWNWNKTYYDLCRKYKGELSC